MERIQVFIPERKELLRTLERDDGFFEVVSGRYIVNYCEPMQRILFKRKNDSDIHILCENHHPDLPINYDGFHSFVIDKGELFKYVKIES